ncbi:MAG: ribosomal protein S18 acetylase RimI-like enzyme [Enterobacterales bacterium]|jgi:ribosomal protein S18 acetylase RimI-like enzyme
MPDTYSFREAKINDLPLIVKWTEDLMEHEAMDESIEISLDDNVSELVSDWLTNLITDNNSLIIIATDDSQTPAKATGLIIGYLQLQPNNFTIFNMHGVIQLVWVEKELRKTGLATQLVLHMEDTFKNLNVPYCEIQYSDSNSEAKAFWEKSGYTKVSHTCRKMLNHN